MSRDAAMRTAVPSPAVSGPTSYSTAGVWWLWSSRSRRGLGCPATTVVGASQSEKKASVERNVSSGTLRLTPSLHERPWVRPGLALLGVGWVYVAYVGTSFFFGASSHAF